MTWSPTAIVNDASHETAFYRAALAALVAAEQHDPTQRRFGSEADAAWQLFRGSLDDADRIDLLIRDAAVQHPAAFAPRTVFAVPDLPEDEPFGPRWRSPFGPDTGRRAWRETTMERRARAPRELWAEALAAWGVEPESLELRSRLDSSSRVLVIGATAIAGLAERFLDDAELDFGRQVVAVASEPAGVQLAGVVPLIAGSRSAVRARRLTEDRTTDPASLLQNLDRTRHDLVVGTRSPTPIEQMLYDALAASN